MFLLFTVIGIIASIILFFASCTDSSFWYPFISALIGTLVFYKFYKMDDQIEDLKYKIERTKGINENEENKNLEE